MLFILIIFGITAIYYFWLTNSFAFTYWNWFTLRKVIVARFSIFSSLFLNKFIKLNFALETCLGHFIYWIFLISFSFINYDRAVCFLDLGFIGIEFPTADWVNLFEDTADLYPFLPLRLRGFILSLSGCFFLI